jgi:flagellar motor switch/type III secretory pathway protein FliN
MNTISPAASRTSAKPAIALSGSRALRRLSSAQAAWSAAIGSGVELVLPAAGGGAAARPQTRLRLEVLPAEQWSQAHGWPRIDLALPGGCAELRLSPHEQWAELALPVQQQLGSDLIAAVAAHVTQDVRLLMTAALLRAGVISSNQCLALARSSQNASHTSASLVIALQVSQQPQDTQRTPIEYQAWLCVPHSVAAPANVTAPRRVKALFEPALPFRLVLAGTSLLSSNVLNALQPGNVVLLDPREPASRSFVGCLALGRNAVATVRALDFDVVPLGVETKPKALRPQIVFEQWADASNSHLPGSRQTPQETVAMSNTSDRTHTDAAAAVLDASVYVEAVLEIPPARVADLHQWTRGTILRTATEIDSTQVLLRVGGQTVGRGRIVAVDSLIGLEIAELFD